VSKIRSEIASSQFESVELDITGHKQRLEISYPSELGKQLSATPSARITLWLSIVIADIHLLH
jgi:hypothetical protein